MYTCMQWLILLGARAHALEELDVSRTAVGDEGVAAVARGCPQLTALRLDATPITDEGWHSEAYARALKEE